MSARVGVAIVGHGLTASGLLEAARGILGVPGLPSVVAVDAGKGATPALASQVCAAIDEVDEGRGVLVIVDLLGASPCQCAQREGDGHEVVMLGGLNLAMLLKLAALDRTRASPAELADACQDSGRRSVTTIRGADQ